MLTQKERMEIASALERWVKRHPEPDKQFEGGQTPREIARDFNSEEGLINYLLKSYSFGEVVDFINESETENFWRKMEYHCRKYWRKFHFDPKKLARKIWDIFFTVPTRIPW